MLIRSVLLIITLILVTGTAIWLANPLSETQSYTLKTLVVLCVGVALLCFVVSEWTENYSQVDRVWSLIPLVYAWAATAMHAFPPRMVLVAVLISIWGIRLTYNFSRLGAYKWPFWRAHEDYRWKILQQKPEFNAKWKWRMFNLFFISLYQNGLILYFTLPILLCSQSSALTSWDYLLAFLILGVLVFETVADNQQWQFQLKKKSSGQRHVGKGFIDTGLWSLVRHPNYLAEQIFWVCIYLFSVIATHHWMNWTIGGCLLLIILFQGSSDFSESISASKYPEYKAYQKRVGRFLPKVRMRR